MRRPYANITSVNRLEGAAAGGGLPGPGRNDLLAILPAGIQCTMKQTSDRSVRLTQEVAGHVYKSSRCSLVISSLEYPVPPGGRYRPVVDAYGRFAGLPCVTVPGACPCPRHCVLFVLLPLKTEATFCPSCQHENGKNEAADESMWEITVNATLMGHNLGAWELTERGDGWQVRCRTCGGTAWVSVSGLQYSLLPDRCSGFDNLTAHK